MPVIIVINERLSSATGLIGEAQVFLQNVAETALDNNHATRLLEVALQHDFTEDTRYYRMRILGRLSYAVASMTQDWAKFDTYVHEFLALAEQLQDQIQYTSGLLFGTINFKGTMAQLKQTFREIYHNYLQSGDLKGSGVATSFLARHTLASGDIEEARQLAEIAYRAGKDVSFFETVGAVALVYLVAGLITDGTISDEWLAEVKAAQKQGVRSYWRDFLNYVFCLISIHDGNYIAARSYILASLKIFLSRPNGLFEATICLPPVVVILKHSGNIQDAIKLTGFLSIQDKDLTGWTQHWQPYIEVQDRLKQEAEKTTYEAMIQEGKTLDLKNILEELVNTL